MPKRDRDTAIWKDTFYRSLSPLYKCFWDFINDDCDNSGVWIVDFKVASLVIGKKIKEEVALELIGPRILIFDDGRKWWIKTFLSEKLGFGELSPGHKFQKSIMDLLDKHKVKEIKGYPEGIQRVIDIGREGNGNRQEQKEGGVGGFEFEFKTAFDEATLEGYDRNYQHKGLDIAEQLKSFRLKCDNDQGTYYARSSATLRTNFQYQLDHARPNNISNGTNLSRKQQQLNRLVEDHEREFGGS